MRQTNTRQGLKVGRLLAGMAALIAVLIAGLAAPAPVLAQNDETGGVQGRVMDARTGVPIPHASVQIQGTTRGGFTSQEGRFRIGELRPGTYTVMVRSIGYRSEQAEVQVQAGTFAPVEFELRVSAVPLDEVVATGQATQVARREVATSIAVIETTPLENVPINSLSELLQARAPGVTVLPSGGMPGQGSRIVLRGLNSLQRSVQPVIYVDGIRIDNSAGTFMASTIGDHGWTGLDEISPEDIERIEIVRGPSAAALYGSEAAAGVIQVFTKQGLDGIQQFYMRSEVGMADTPRSWWELPLPRDVPYGHEADWYQTARLDNFYDQYVSTGMQYRQHLSVRGSVDRFSYYASGTHRDVDGVLPNSRMGQTAFRGNMNVSPFQEFNLGISTGFSRRIMDLPYDGNHEYGFGLNALGARRRIGEDGLEHMRRGVNLTPYRVMGLEARLASSRFTAGTTMDWAPTRNWNHRLVLGLEFFTTDNTDLRPFGNPASPNSEGSKVNTRRIANTYNLDYQTTYGFDITPTLRSRTSFGVQGYTKEDGWNWAYGEGWPAPGLITIQRAAEQTGTEDRIYTEQLGVFLEEQLSFQDYLYLTLAGRFDGHSAAGANARWQLYPKVGVSYLPSEQGILPAAFGTLRLRAAYGEAGNVPTPYSALRSYRGIIVDSGDTPMGMIPLNIGDPNLAPERNREIELGADMALLNDRISAEVTYYTQRIDNAIFPVYDISSYGFVHPQARNVAAMRAQGLELAADVVLMRSAAFTWRVSTNLALHESEVEDFGDETAIPENLYGTQWIRPGYPVASFFDEDGEHIGPAYPTTSLQVGSQIRLRGGLSLRGLLDHQRGHYLESNTLRVLDEAAAPAGTVFDAPPSDYVFPADFWRLREVVLGYELPQGLYAALPIQALELSVSGRNLWRSQSYPGIEAQASYNPGLEMANQTFFGAPLARQMVVGLTMRFGGAH